MRKSRKVGMTLLETSIAMTVLSFIFYIFYAFLNQTTDNFHRRLTIERMDFLEGKIIEYIAQNRLERIQNDENIFPLRSKNKNLKVVTSGSTLTKDFLELELSKKLTGLSGDQLKNTFDKRFYLITSKNFSTSLKHQNIAEHAISAYKTASDRLTYDTFRDKVVYAPNMPNAYFNSEDPLAFLICEDGAIKKKKQFCRGITIPNMLYKIKKLSDNKSRQIIHLDKIVDSQTEAESFLKKNPNKFYKFFVNDQKAYMTGIWKGGSLDYLYFKKQTEGELLLIEDKLYRAHNNYLEIINSLIPENNIFYQVQMLVDGDPDPNVQGIYVTNKSGSTTNVHVFQVDEHGQKILVFDAVNEQLVFDRKTSAIYSYDKPKNTWSAKIIKDLSSAPPPPSKNLECGGLPCAVPGIRKCGPPNATDKFRDVYGRFIVNDFLLPEYNEPGYDPLFESYSGKVHDSNNINAVGLYLQASISGPNTKDTTPIGGNSKATNVLYKYVKNSSGISKDPNFGSKEGFAAHNMTNRGAEPYITNDGLKTFEVCKKGVGVFALNEEIFYEYDTNPISRTRNLHAHPMLAVIDGDVEIDYVETDPTKDIYKLPDQKAILLESQSTLNNEAIGCIAGNYPVLYYKDMANGNQNPLVGFFANKPFKIKEKKTGKEIDALPSNNKKTILTYNMELKENPSDAKHEYYRRLMYYIYKDWISPAPGAAQLLDVKNIINIQKGGIKYDGNAGSKCYGQMDLGGMQHKLKFWQDSTNKKLRLITHINKWLNNENYSFHYYYENKLARYRVEVINRKIIGYGILKDSLHLFLVNSAPLGASYDTKPTKYGSAYMNHTLKIHQINIDYYHQSFLSQHAQYYNDPDLILHGDSDLIPSNKHYQPLLYYKYQNGILGDGQISVTQGSITKIIYQLLDPQKQIDFGPVYLLRAP